MIISKHHLIMNEIIYIYFTHSLFSVPQFRALAPMYYRGSAAAIIVYDITKEVFFFSMKHLLINDLILSNSEMYQRDVLLLS